jgi:hypothetical protein
MKKTLFAFAIVIVIAAAAFVAPSHLHRRSTMTSQLNGAWELVSGQPLPKGARDMKIISEGHFMFTAYDTQTGKPLYSAGGTYVLAGSSYTEHMDFASDKIAAGLIGKDQQFTVKVDGDGFTQTGTLSNGKVLSEVWKRID